MLRALVWKEYREQLPVAVAGMAISLVLPFVVVSMVAATMSQADPMDMADVLRFVLAVMVWPIFAAAIGATTFASDGRSANLGFLLSRPVARGWVWLAKTVTGALTVVVVVGTSWLISRTFDYLIAGPSTRPSLSSGPLNGTEGFAAANVFALIALSFALSVLFAGLWERSLTAAGSGLAVGLGLVVLSNAYWQAIGTFSRDVGARIILTQLGLVSMAILVVSLYAFARSDLLERRAYRWRLALGAGVVLVIWIVGTAGLLFAETRLDPSYARLSNPRLTPSGEGVIVRADRENGRAPQIWLIGFDGELRRLTPRLTRFRGFTEDGESIFYESRRGWLGFPSKDPQVRGVRLDGTDDRFVEEDQNYWYYNTWVPSPDGRLQARFEYERSRYNERQRRLLVVASSDGVEVERIDPRVIGSPWDWAWREDSSGIVFNRRRALTLTFYDLTTGEFEDLIQHSVVHNRDAIWSGLPDPLGNHVRLSRRSSYGDERQVIWAVDDIDIETGEISTIFEVRGPGAPSRNEWYCGKYVRLSADRNRFFYTTCVSYPHAVQRAWKVDIHIVDLETGENRIWTTIEGSFVRLRMGPGGKRMLVHFNQPLVNREKDLRPPAMWDWRTFDAIVEPDGTLLELEDGWMPIEWMDQGRILVSYRPEIYEEKMRYGSRGLSRYGAFTRLGIVDVETGNLEVFYP